MRKFLAISLSCLLLFSGTAQTLTPPSNINNLPEVFSGDNNELNEKIKRFGLKIFEESTLTKKEKYSPTQTIIKWAMKDEYTKTQILSFIYALPGLKSKSIIQHVQEYFPVKDKRLPALLRGLVRIAGWVTKVPVVKYITIPITAGLIKSSVTYFANTFFAGQTKEEVTKTLKNLKKEGLTHTIDNLGEASLTYEEAEDYMNKYLDLLDVEGIESVSLKLTSLCPVMAFDPINPKGAIDAVIEPLRIILRKAQRKNVSVNIDMEKYEHKQITLEIFKKILKEDEFKNYTKFGIVIQAYLKDSEKDLRGLLKFARAKKGFFTVRLVKGCYWEDEKRLADIYGWPSTVYEKKHETDKNYEQLTRLLLDNCDVVRPAIASHNIRSIAHAVVYAEEQGIGKKKYEIQMLYGMGNQFKRFFAERGYTVRVYTPYGEIVPGMGYLMRRILENTSNDSFLRQAYLDKKEIERLLLSPDEQAELAEPEVLDAKTTGTAEEPRVVSQYKKMPKIRKLRTKGDEISFGERVKKSKEVFEQYGFTSWETRLHYVDKLFEILRSGIFKDGPEIRKVLEEQAEYIKELLRNADEFIQSLPGERNTYHYNPVGPGLVVLDKKPSKEDLFKMLCVSLITGNTALVCFTDNVPEPARESVKNFITLCEYVGFSRYAIQIMDYPLNITEYILRHPDISWISYYGSDDNVRDYRLVALTYNHNQHTIRRFIHEITPDYPLEFLYAKSIAENTIRRGYAPGYGIGGGHLLGFNNIPPVDFRDRDNHKRMKEALQKVAREIKEAEERQPYLSQKNILVSRNPWKPSQIVGRTYLAREEHVKQAEKEARKAFRSWSKKSAGERAVYLYKAGNLMQKRRFELAALQVYEVGKTWRGALADVNEAIDFVYYYANLAQYIEEKDKEVKGFKRKSNGVCVVVPPWNFPLAILTGMVIGAIASGSTVLLKPSSDSPITGYKLMEILMDQEVGLPAGVVNFLPGSGKDIGDALIEHSDMPAFTGSEAVGMGIIEKYYQRDKAYKVVAEMGGKGALIISNSADLDVGVLCVLKSAFGYSGQKCSACSRVIVMEDIYDEFLRRLKGAVEVLKVGNPKEPSTDMGPLINEKAKEKVLEFIKLGRSAESRKEGVKVLIDRSQADDIPKYGHFVGPTVFYDVPRNHTLAQEEIFGPVLSVIKAKDFSDALDIANDTRYALTGGIITRTPGEIEAVKRRFNVGNLYINRGITGAIVEWQPFGGYKHSGLGSKAGGPDYLYRFMHWERTDDAGPEEFVAPEKHTAASL